VLWCNLVTDGDIPSGPAKKGRPFSDATERAILAATAQLLEEKGLADISIEEVATRARVGKASVYRRWPSKGTLALDAFEAEFIARQPPPDTGSLRGDLTAALRAWVRTVNDTPMGRTLRGLIAEVQRDPALREIWRERFVTPVRAQHRLIVERAMARGEISPATDPEIILDLAFGAGYHRLLNGHAALDDAFVKKVVTVLLAATGASGG
jgi:AcrR family transcriptional regulator